MVQTMKVVSGVLAIILGIAAIAFPFAGLLAASMLVGFGILLIGIVLLAFGVAEMSSSKTLGTVLLVIGILVLIAGIGLFGHIRAFEILTSFWLYLSGLVLAVSGVIYLFSKAKYARAAGVLGIVMGVVYIVLGTFALNPMALAALIGIWLVLTGITRLL